MNYFLHLNDTILNHLLVFFHKKLDSIWIPLGVIPKKITSYKLNIASIPELVSIDITLTEVSSSDLNKESSHCSEEDRVDFNTCSQIYLASYFNDKVNCTLPGNSL